MKRHILLLSTALGLMACDRGTRHDTKQGYGSAGDQPGYGAKTEDREEYRTESPYYDTKGEVTEGEMKSAGREVREEGQELKHEAKEEGAELREDVKETGREIRSEARETGEEIKSDVKQTGEEIKQEGRELREDMNAKASEEPQGPPPETPKEVSDEDLKRLDDADLRKLTDKSFGRGVAQVNKELYETNTNKKLDDFAKRCDAIRDNVATYPEIAVDLARVDTQIMSARRDLDNIKEAKADTYRPDRDKLTSKTNEIEHMIGALEARLAGMKLNK